jgi:diguanylate cyclase (GGDEF)-like protein
VKDARLDELRFLARLERERLVTFSHRKPAEDIEIRIAIQLLAAGLVNDGTVSPSHDDYEFVYDRSRARADVPYRTRIAFEQWEAIGRLHQGQEVRILATHAAAVRRAELEQSILYGRLKDPTGILFDAWHADRDLQVALFSASTTEPLTIAFLDMNGLRQFNNEHGHAAGDEAICAFFEVIAAVAAEKGDAYRVGGDEVMILFSNTGLVEGTELLRTILRGLGTRRVSEQSLSAAAGITSVTNPTELPINAKKKADEIQYRAKAVSKSRPPARFGVLAIDGQGAVEEFLP